MAIKKSELYSSLWASCDELRAELFAPAASAGYSQAKVGIPQIKAAIFSHAEFKVYHQATLARFERWKQKNKPLLVGLKTGSHHGALAT